jgi:DNA-binding response OmpR family regulator
MEEMAVEAFILNPVDLVLLDYYVPEANGDVVARRMKAHKSDVPIFISEWSLSSVSWNKLIIW